MTTQEFSNTFDTLLNSYASEAQFGEQASKGEIVLDEYEKSVLLTQAQDIIVKQYFQRTNVNEGFDDSSRRQIDFSSLISVDQGVPVNQDGQWSTVTKSLLGTTNTFQGTGTGKSQMRIIIYTNVAQNDNWTVTYSETASSVAVEIRYKAGVTPNTYKSNIKSKIDTSNTTLGTKFNALGFASYNSAVSANYVLDLTSKCTQDESFDTRGIMYEMPTDLLFVLNEQFRLGNKAYVVVPINYKEYDRQMSKPFAQPLKKQAWRLFQGDPSSVDAVSEIILTDATLSEEDGALTDAQYFIRYIRRPNPIIVADLTNAGLDIDGKQEVSECELNPILHMDILNKAVELALTTRGTRPTQQQSNNQQK